MSQLPPIPPQQPGQPSYQPPYPPGGVPPGAAVYTMPAPSRTNGWAVAALIVSIVAFCLPFAGGAVAMVLGAVGLAYSRRTQSGKGLAIAGLILGLASIGLWSLIGGGVWALIAGTKVNRDLAGQYIRDLAAGNVAAAVSASDTSSIDPEDLPKLSATIKGFGEVKDVTSFSTKVVSGEAELVGVVEFADGRKRGFKMSQRKLGGVWKVIGFEISKDTPNEQKPLEELKKLE